MAEIKELKDIEWVLNENENIYIGYSPDLDSTKMGFLYAMLKPGQELKLHYHERPENGDEAFIFPYKGKIRLKTIENDKIKENEYTIEDKNPLSFSFKNEERHGITNIGSENIIFIVIYAPAFIPGEVKHDKQHNL